MRKYEISHPWIKFNVDLIDRIGPSFWVLLGEAASKCEHVAGVPLPPDVQAHFNQVYLAKGVLATTAIEGNTLSEEQVLAHLDGKLELPPSKEYLKTEIANVLSAANEIWRDKTGGFDRLGSELIQKFNLMVLNGLQLEKGVVAGRIRSHDVGVEHVRYRGAPWEDCEHLVGRLVEWLNGPLFDTTERPELGLPVALIKAVLAHLYIVWIHPFGDGNGRTARLVELQILSQAGVPMPSAHLLSNHYNATRPEYYRQLAHASESGGDVLPFLTYAIKGFIEELRLQVEEIKSHQWQFAWRDFVHEAFAERKTAGDARRETLVLALSDPDFVPRSKIAMVTPEVAKAYAGKTAKTLTRDLNILEAKKLLKSKDGDYRANMGIMLAFQPMRKKNEHDKSRGTDRRIGARRRTTEAVEQ